MIQPRLREIDRFFFITRGRRLFTEGVGSGAIDTWQASVTKKNGGIFGRSPYEHVERSCGVIQRWKLEVCDKMLENW